MPRLSIEEIQALSVSERVQLAEQIWESIAAQPDMLEVTKAQRAELDRRLEAAQSDPDASIPWEEARRKVERRR